MNEDLQEIVNAVLKAIPVEKIYLFGSYAVGNYTNDSDYDIYIIMPDNAMRQHDAVVDVYKSLSLRTSYSKPVDIITGYSSIFKERKDFPTLERLVSRQGVLLYEKK